MPHSLHGIAVKTDAGLFSNSTYFLYGLYGAYFVAGMDDRDEDCFSGNSFLDTVRVNQPIFIHWQVGYPETPLLQELAHLQHRMVLNSGGDDVLPFILISEGHTLQGEIVRLRPSAGENNFLATCPNKLCHAGSCLFHGPLCLLPVRIDAGRIAKGIGKIGQHSFHYFRVSRRSGCMIKIYSLHFRGN